MNSVTLIGNLATDVELREVGEERKAASFLLAVDRPGKDDRADSVRVACWNRVADSCGRFLSKGRRVAVDGRLLLPLVGGGGKAPDGDRSRGLVGRVPRRAADRDHMI